MRFTLLIIFFILLACSEPFNEETTSTLDSVTIDTVYTSSSDTIYSVISSTDTIYIQIPIDGFTGIKTRIVLNKYDRVESTFYDHYEDGILFETEEFNSQNNLIRRYYFTITGDTLTTKVFG